MVGMIRTLKSRRNHMLYSIDSGKYVTTNPHKKDFEKWMNKLSEEDYKKIIAELNSKIDQSDVNTAGWLPGHDWTGTVYEPIFDACGKNVTQSGMFFGLIVFDLLMKRKDNVWGFGRFEKDGKQIASMTYFIIGNPPQNR